MTAGAAPPILPAESLGSRVRHAVIWRSGSQLAAQIVQWAATFLVIRILTPQDYGMFAMTLMVLVLLNMANGYGLASGLIQQHKVSTREVGQLFGMVLVLNLGLGAAQALLAPLAAAYCRQPVVADPLRVRALLYGSSPCPTPCCRGGCCCRRQATRAAGRGRGEERRDRHGAARRRRRDDVRGVADAVLARPGA